MTMYTDLLEAILADAYHQTTIPIGDLLGLVLQGQTRHDEEVTPGDLTHQGSDAATWTAAQLSYDAALVNLCERMGIDQALTRGAPSGAERKRLEGLIHKRAIDLVL